MLNDSVNRIQGKMSLRKLHGREKLYLTIIPRARVGYINNSLHLARKYARIFVRGHYLFRVANSFPIDSQRGAKRRVGYNHLISNKREWNNCFIKNHQQILQDFADFA